MEEHIEIDVAEPMGYLQFFAAMRDARERGSAGMAGSWVVGADIRYRIALEMTLCGPLVTHSWGDGRVIESISGLPIRWSSSPHRLGKSTLIFAQSPVAD